MEDLPRGAAAVLHSKLATTGYRLPTHYVLTEDEARNVYDIEVRVRLGHVDSSNPLMGLLLDLPPNAVLSCTGLLEAVLDLIGGMTYSQHDAVNGTDLEDAGGLALSICSLSPRLGLHWCRQLLNSAINCFSTLMEGSMVSTVPAESLLGTLQNQTTAIDMLRSMLTMRYPSCGWSDKSQKADVSLPGFAFACCAAALPLLMRSRDPGLLYELTALAKEAIPYVREPHGDFLTQHSKEVALQSIEVSRFQHLVDRIEQVISFLGETPNVDVYFGDSSPSSLSDSVVDTNVAVIAIVLALFHEIPSISIGNRGDLVNVGPKTTLLLIRLCLVHADRLPTVERKELDEVILAVDIAASQKILKLRAIFDASAEILQIVNSLDLSRLNHAASMASVAVELIELGSMNSVSASDIQSGTCCKLIDAIIVLYGVSVSRRATGETAADELLLVISRIFLCKSETFRSRTMSALACILNPHLEPTPSSDILTSIVGNTDLGPLADLVTAHLSTYETFAIILSNIIGFLQPAASKLIVPHDALVVVESLSTYILRFEMLSEHQISKWSQLMHPLRLLSIAYRSQQDDAVFMALHALRSKLEDCCGSSALVLKSWVVGLFSTAEEARLEAAMKLKSAILVGVQSFSRKHDPFPDGSSLRLANISGDSGHGISIDDSALTDFAHHDTKKLAAVAFGNFDASIRMIAVRQLRLRLEDSQLLLTADFDWVKDVAANCISVMTKIEWTGIHIFLAVLPELCLECAHILNDLVANDGRIRHVMELSKQGSDSLSLNCILLPFLLQNLVYRNSPIDILLSIFGRILSNWALSAENWAIQFESLHCKERYRMSPQRAFACDIAVVPSFLIGYVGSISLSPGNVAHSDAVFSTYILRNPIILCERDFVQSDVDITVSGYLNFVHDAFVLEPTSNVHDYSVSHVLERMVNARGHSTIRESMCIGRLLALCRTSRSTLFAERIPSILHKLLGISPGNNRDLLTLSIALHFISDLIDNIPKGKVNANLLELVCDGVFETLAPILILSFTLRNETSHSSANQSYIVDSRVAIIRTMKCLQPHVSDTVWTKRLLRSGIPIGLARISCDEVSPVYLRSGAAELLRMLVSCPEIWMSIMAPIKLTSPEKRLHNQVSCIDELMRTICLLRAPDSSKRISIVVGSLGILVTGSTANAEWSGSRDLRPMLRLLHDRRATVRALTARLFESILDSLKACGCASLPLSCSSEPSAQGSILESIKAVMLDNYECGAVRLVCMRILLKHGPLEMSDIAAILGCCSSMINVNGTDNSIIRCGSCLSVALDVVFDLLCSKQRSEILLLLRQVKMFPLTIGILHRDCVRRIVEASIVRSDINGCDTYTSINSNVVSPSSGWGYQWDLYRSSLGIFIGSAKASACRLMHAISVYDDTFAESSLVHSEALPLILDSFADFSASTSSLMLTNFRIFTDFLAMLLALPCDKVLIDATCIALRTCDLILGRLRLLCDAMKSSDGAYEQSVISAVLSSFRLLSVMLENNDCRIGFRALTHQALILILIEFREIFILSSSQSSSIVCLLYRSEMLLAQLLKHYNSDSECCTSIFELLRKVLQGILPRLNFLLFAKNPEHILALRLLKSKPSKPKKMVTSPAFNKARVVGSPNSITEIQYENKWRAQTREYIVTEQDHYKVDKDRSEELAPLTAISVHGSLLLLLHLIKFDPCEAGFAVVLGNILRVAPNWASVVRKESDKTGASSYIYVAVPSHRQLVATALGAIEELVSHGDIRVLSGMSSKAVAMPSSSSASIGVSLSQLMNLGLSKEIDVGIRWMSLGLATYTLRLFSSLSIPQNSIMSSLQQQFTKSLHGPIDGMTFFLLELYLTLNEERDNGRGHGVSFPEMLQWVGSKGSNEELLLATVKSIGRMASSSSKKVRAAAFSHDAVLFLYNQVESTINPSLLAAASVALWYIVRSSEPALASLSKAATLESLAMIRYSTEKHLLNKSSRHQLQTAASLDAILQHMTE